MNGIPYVYLLVISSFTMNLSLQCALGIRGLAETKTYNQFSVLLKLGIIFISLNLVWILFSAVISNVLSGIALYGLLFPVSFMVYEGFEYLAYYLIFKNGKNRDKDNSFVGFPGGVTAAASFVCLNIANNFLEAFFISFGFCLGIFIVCLIIREIRRRSALEAIPKSLRGKPLVVITLGLLSLVFSAVSLLFLRMINIK